MSAARNLTVKIDVDATDAVRCLKQVRPMFHRVDWYVETEDVRGEITCTAPEGAACRQVCAADPPCQEVCVGEDPETGEEHPMQDSGYCNDREWMSSEDAAFYYAGERAPAVSGPIVTYWHPDEHMVWTYPGHEHHYRKEFGRTTVRCACGAREPKQASGSSLQDAHAGSPAEQATS
jgi:hypothetical protein